MTNISTHAEAMANVHPAASGAADTARALSKLSGANDAAIAETIWGQAHKLYHQLRVNSGENFAAFDRGWQILRNSDLPPIERATAARQHYEALIARGLADDAIRDEARAEALSAGPSLAETNARAAYASGSVLEPFWTAGTDLAQLAESIAASCPVKTARPAVPTQHYSVYCGGKPATVIGDDAELSAALDVADAGLARIAAQLAAVRADVKARAKVTA